MLKCFDDTKNLNLPAAYRLNDSKPSTGVQNARYLPVTAKMPQTPETGPDFAEAGGLLPAIAQDAETGEVLMMAYMNADSYAETVATGRAVYYSRSRNQLWRKGEQSGNIQQVRAIYLDCDRDTILLKVRQIGGAACHKGYRSCFFQQVTPDGLQVVARRVFDPDEVYGKSGD